MEWTVPCSKNSGELRKQFAQWAIPKALRDKFSIRDGHQLFITISHIDYIEDHLLRVSSGGEIYVPKTVALRIEKQAKSNPSTSVKFSFCVDNVPESQKIFDRAVTLSRLQTSEQRLARLKNANKTPKTRLVMTTVFDRNPDVVAEVLLRADGVCERCKNDAPFKRSSDGSPYLEVHHRVQLSQGGDDTVENALAICPNCHRQAHYGFGQ